jgi:hypothetical protein
MNNNREINLTIVMFRTVVRRGLSYGVNEIVRRRLQSNKWQLKSVAANARPMRRRRELARRSVGDPFSLRRSPLAILTFLSHVIAHLGSTTGITLQNRKASRTAKASYRLSCVPLRRFSVRRSPWTQMQNPGASL